jgi:hypothetical protein
MDSKSANFPILLGIFTGSGWPDNIKSDAKLAFQS